MERQWILLKPEATHSQGGDSGQPTSRSFVLAQGTLQKASNLRQLSIWGYKKLEIYIQKTQKIVAKQATQFHVVLQSSKCSTLLRNVSNYIFQLWLCLHAIIREEIPSRPKRMLLCALKYLNENDWIIFMHYRATTSKFLIPIYFFKFVTLKTRDERNLREILTRNYLPQHQNGKVWSTFL